ncbi:hypothetical protein REPUB_Repub13aG0178400 [Reevesia pubescens]
MERNSMKKVMVTLMMLMMVVVAQGRAVGTDFNPDTSTKQCAKRCGLSCALEVIPSVVALCFSICMLECKLQPSQDVYNCTSACAKSAVDADRKAGIDIHLSLCLIIFNKVFYIDSKSCVEIRMAKKCKAMLIRAMGDARTKHKLACYFVL